MAWALKVFPRTVRVDAPTRIQIESRDGLTPPSVLVLEWSTRERGRLIRQGSTLFTGGVAELSWAEIGWRKLVVRDPEHPERGPLATATIQVVGTVSREFWAFPQPAPDASAARRLEWPLWKAYVCCREKLDQAGFERLRQRANEDAAGLRRQVKRDLDVLIARETGHLKLLPPEDSEPILDNYHAAYVRAVEGALTYEPGRGTSLNSWFQAIRRSCTLDELTQRRRDRGRGGQDENALFDVVQPRPRPTDVRPVEDVVLRVEVMIDAGVQPSPADLEVAARARLREAGRDEPSPAEVSAAIDGLLARGKFRDRKAGEVAERTRLAELHVMAFRQAEAATLLPPGYPALELVALSAALMRDFVGFQKKKDKGRPLPSTVLLFGKLQECWRRLRGLRLGG
jgi:hypothetical protein